MVEYILISKVIVTSLVNFYLQNWGYSRDKKPCRHRQEKQIKALLVKRISGLSSEQYFLSKTKS